MGCPSSFFTFAASSFWLKPAALRASEIIVRTFSLSLVYYNPLIRVL
jgi:hypothetical protein